MSAMPVLDEKADDWREELGFTERSTATLDLVAALKKTNVPPTDHLHLARSTEATCYADASSLANYHHLISTALLQLVPGPTPETHHIAPHLPPASQPPIGKYTNPSLEHTTLSANVYRATAEDGGVVCLKLSQSPQPAPHNARLEARILRECTEGKAPGVLRYLEEFVHKETASLVLVTPWLEFSLADHLAPGPRQLSLQDLKKVMYQTTEALAFLHAHDILHRDIKPENIMLSTLSPPTAHLIDFSISWSPSSPEPANSKYPEIGTSWFRAPELLFGSRNYGPGVDLWALGCVLAQACNLNAEPIFEAGDMGTELTLISSLFRTLGTPDENVWPECKELPDWGKVQFYRFEGKEWREIVTGERAGEEVRELVGGLVCWESGRRMRAVEVLRHRWFDEVREEMERR